jgi:hypothetical protein
MERTVEQIRLELEEAALRHAMGGGSADLDRLARELLTRVQQDATGDLVFEALEAA